MRPVLKSSDQIGRWVALAIGVVAYAAAVFIALKPHG